MKDIIEWFEFNIWRFKCVFIETFTEAVYWYDYVIGIIMWLSLIALILIPILINYNCL